MTTITIKTRLSALALAVAALTAANLTAAEARGFASVARAASVAHVAPHPATFVRTAIQANQGGFGNARTAWHVVTPRPPVSGTGQIKPNDIVETVKDGANNLVDAVFEAIAEANPGPTCGWAVCDR